MNTFTYTADAEDNVQFDSKASNLALQKQRQVIRMKQLEHGLQRVAKEIEKRTLINRW